METQNAMRRFSPFLVAMLGVAALDARAASYTELLGSVPPPPADAATARSWVKDGQVVAPEYLQFKQKLEAERAAIAELNGGTAPAAGTPVSLAAAEGPEVQAAVRGYNSYLAQHADKAEPSAALAKRTRWIQAAMGQKLATIMQRMQPCAEPCQDPAIVAANQPLLAQKQKLAEEDIKYWNVLFADWTKTRGKIVSGAQAEIAAAGEGAKAVTPAGKAALAQYRAAMLKEVDVTLSLTELAVKRAWAIETGGITADAYSGATKKAKKT